jgi:hypothetical protein
MPQPIHPADRRFEIGLHYGTRVIAKRPACALGIATVAGEWANLERSLALMFSVSTGWPTDDRATTKINRVARAAIDAIESLSARLAIVSAGLEATMPQAVQDQFDDLAKRIRKCAGTRNTVVHGWWGVSEKYPDDVILNTDVGPVIRYTPKDFDEIVSRIANLVLEIDRLRDVCLRAMRQGGVAPTPTTPSVYRSLGRQTDRTRENPE